MIPHLQSEAPSFVRNAVEEFNVPDGYTVLDINKVQKTSSKVWGYGVVVKEDTTDKYLFSCLASAACRRENKMVSLGSNGKLSTSNIKKHIGISHQQFTTAYASKQKENERKIEQYHGTHLYKQEPSLCREYLWMLLIVMNHLPFILIETFEARALFACDENMNPLYHHKILKRRIIEVYAHIKVIIRSEITEAFRYVAAPFITVVIDGWKSKQPGMKYVGVRIYYVNKDGVLKTKLLSVRQFDPSYLERSTFQLSKVYYNWMVWILGQRI